MVPPALATIASALLGMAPPVKATRYDCAAVSALLSLWRSAEGAAASEGSPHPISDIDNPTNTTANDDDRIGLRMMVSSIKGALSVARRPKSGNRRLAP